MKKWIIISFTHFIFCLSAYSQFLEVWDRSYTPPAECRVFDFLHNRKEACEHMHLLNQSGGGYDSLGYLTLKPIDGAPPKTPFTQQYVELLIAKGGKVSDEVKASSKEHYTKLKKTWDCLDSKDAECLANMTYDSYKVKKKNKFISLNGTYSEQIDKYRVYQLKDICKDMGVLKVDYSKRQYLELNTARDFWKCITKKESIDHYKLKYSAPLEGDDSFYESGMQKLKNAGALTDEARLIYKFYEPEDRICLKDKSGHSIRCCENYQYIKDLLYSPFFSYVAKNSDKFSEFKDRSVVDFYDYNVGVEGGGPFKTSLKLVDIDNKYYLHGLGNQSYGYCSNIFRTSSKLWPKEYSLLENGCEINRYYLIKEEELKRANNYSKYHRKNKYEMCKRSKIVEKTGGGFDISSVINIKKQNSDNAPFTEQYISENDEHWYTYKKEQVKGHEEDKKKFAKILYRDLKKIWSCIENEDQKCLAKLTYLTDGSYVASKYRAYDDLRRKLIREKRQITDEMILSYEIPKPTPGYPGSLRVCLERNKDFKNVTKFTSSDIWKCVFSETNSKYNKEKMLRGNYSPVSSMSKEGLLRVLKSLNFKILGAFDNTKNPVKPEVHYGTECFNYDCCSINYSPFIMLRYGTPVNPNGFAITVLQRNHGNFKRLRRKHN